MAAKGACKIVKPLSNLVLLGTCMPTLKHNASKIRVRRLELDNFLYMYFPRYDIFYAHDPQKVCKVGDVVLIKQLPKKLTTTITHEVLEVVYPFGDVTDPITNEKAIRDEFRVDLEKIEEAFGKLPTAFDYKKAPPRGWQEGKRDFSDKETYVKYHEFPEDDDNHDQPYGVEEKYK